jgi:hypothetical protein
LIISNEYKWEIYALQNDTEDFFVRKVLLCDYHDAQYHSAFAMDINKQVICFDDTRAVIFDVKERYYRTPI